MGNSTLTEEPVIDRPADVVTEDGPSGEQPAVHEADTPSSGELDALDDEQSAGDSEGSEGGEDEQDDDDDGQDSGDDKPPRHGKKTWQKRVDKLTRRLSERERELAEKEGRLKALEEMLEKGIARRTDGQDDGSDDEPAAPPEPQPEDFDTVEEYARAYSKWEREAEAPQAQQPNESQPDAKWAPSKESLEVRQKAFEAAKAEFDDLEDRLDAVAPSMTLPMLKAVEFDEDGARILAHLAEHPDELKRIAGLTDEKSVSKALQRFAGKVLGEAPSTTSPAKPEPDDELPDDPTPRASRQPAAARVTRAQPVGTVLRGGRVSSEPDLDGMSQEDYEAYMNRKQYGRG